MPLVLLLSLYIPIGLAIFFYIVKLCKRRKNKVTVNETYRVCTVLYGNIKPPKQEECSICLEKFCRDNEVADLSCPHLFHMKCLQPWLVIKNACPLCRIPIDCEYGAM